MGNEGMMKAKIISSLLISMFLTLPVFATDLIRDACYTTKKCGARKNLQYLVALAGAQTGALAGVESPVPGGLVMGGVGGYVVGKNLGGKFAKNYSANEYIYFDNGTCLECDTHQIGENYECPNGTIVFNGSHVLQCHTTMTGDYWEERSLSPCSNSPIKNVSATGTEVEIQANIRKEVYSGVNVYSGDACLYIKCANDGTYNQSKNTCEKNISATPDMPDQNNAGNTPGGNGEGTTSSCITRRCKNLTGAQKAECAVCCAVPASVAKWNGSACKCVDTSKKFDVATGTCQASTTTPPTNVTPAQPSQTFECDASKLAQLAQWRIKYSKNQELVALIDTVLAYCRDANRNEIVFNSYYSELLALIAQIDAAAAAATTAQQQQAEINIRIRRIRNATSNIQTMADAFKVSKWKNEEGNFNTSRLVSDSVAGVVLGTAGGLITSNVIKKNQVKGGFEDISCTIGGQVVAGWKDEFRVGIH